MTPTEKPGEAALLPCPFCGTGRRSIESGGDMPISRTEYQATFVVHCSCGSEGTTALSVDGAAEAWNRRALAAQAAKPGEGDQSLIAEQALAYARRWAKTCCESTLELQRVHVAEGGMEWRGLRQIIEHLASPPKRIFVIGDAVTVGGVHYTTMGRGVSPEEMALIERCARAERELAEAIAAKGKTE